ncbi:MAG: glycosyltransferase family 4 protein [Chitinispirillaceae bacterium]|nr:glycosyltransferase family 4 protein [Chitinispirillaceae bacterium]
MPGTEQRRLLFINHWARELGGAELSLLDILEEAAGRCETHLVSAEEGELLRRARLWGVTSVSFPGARALAHVRRGRLLVTMIQQWRGILSFAGYVLRVKKYVTRVRPHLIHANVPKSHMTLFLLRWSGYRGICSFHIRELFEKKSFPHRLYSLLFKPERSMVIAISQTVQSSLPPSMARSATVIYNGVSIGPAKGTITKSDEHLRFIYLGRIVPWKGCHLLIKAFARLHARLGTTAGFLDLVGGTLYWDQAYRHELKMLIEKKSLASYCRLLPHSADPIATLSNYDVFCTASIKEPFGRAVAEAQGCGLPVIAFDDGGIGEIVEHDVTGLLVRAGSVEALAQAMGCIASDDSMRVRMGSAARCRTMKLFDIVVQRKRIVDHIIDGSQPVSRKSERTE